MGEWQQMGFSEYANDYQLARWAGPPPLVTMPNDRLRGEPEGELGSDLRYVIRSSGVDRGSSRGHVWPETGYCEGSARTTGLGLFGFLEGAGIWELPILMMGYVDTFQVLVVRASEIMESDDRSECTFPRAWVAHSGSLSQVLLFLDGVRSNYANHVASQLCTAMARVAQSIGDQTLPESVAIRYELRSQLNTYYRCRGRAA